MISEKEKIQILSPPLFCLLTGIMEVAGICYQFVHIENLQKTYIENLQELAATFGESLSKGQSNIKLGALYFTTQY